MSSDSVDWTGSGLVSNTSICEVSRLLISDKPSRSAAHDRWAPRPPLQDESYRDQVRVFDLLSLIEAVVLHERIYTLPCKASSDVAQLALRKQLMAAGVLKELDTRNEHAKIVELIHQSLLPFQSANATSSQPSSLAVADVKIDPAKAFFIREFLGIADRKIHKKEAGKKRKTHQATLRLYDTHEDASSLYTYSNFGTLASSLVAPAESQESGSYEDDHKNLGSFLREMYYIVVSEHFGLPYWPQFTRLGFAKKFPNYFSTSFRSKLFRRVAEALKSTLTEVFDDLQEQIAFIPPFSSLVLERSARPEDIATNLLSVRQDYKNLRHNLVELEQARRDATSIKARKGLREKERLLLEGAAASFESPKTVRLEGVIRYIPELVKPISAPLDPTKYSADLLLKPLQWLADWWRKRPIAPVFNLAAKVGDIDEYSQLVNKVFGNRFYYSAPWEDVITAGELT